MRPQRSSRLAGRFVPRDSWTHKQLWEQCRDLSRAIVEVTNWHDIEGTRAEGDLVDELRAFGDPICAATHVAPNAPVSERQVAEWGELRSRALAILKREVADA